MFHKINEEKYLNIISYTKEIYDNLIEHNMIKSSYSSSCINNYEASKRDKIIKVYKNNKGQFNDTGERILFQLNLIITENNRFANSFYEYCQSYLRTDDINRINMYFFTREIKRTTKWNMLLERLAREFLVKKDVVVLKIGEILTYKDMYFPSLVEEKEEVRKSLSL